MNNEVKEILIDLIAYYNVIGTEDDPGFGPFAEVVSRASKALERSSKEQKFRDTNRSSDIDPFAMDVVGTRRYKHENDL